MIGKSYTQREEVTKVRSAAKVTKVGRSYEKEKVKQVTNKG